MTDKRVKVAEMYWGLPYSYLTQEMVQEALNWYFTEDCDDA